MPDPNDAASQAETPSSSPATTTAETAAQAAAPESSQAEESPEESISLSEAKKLRKEAKGLRERIAVAEEKARKLEEEKMTESERIAARLKTTEEENAKLKLGNRDAVTHYAVALASQKLGVVDPEVMAKLIDPAELQYGSDGLPTNVEDLIKEVLKEKTYLRATTQVVTPTSAGNPANPASQAPNNPNAATSMRIGSFTDYLKMDKAKLFDSIRNGTYDPS